MGVCGEVRLLALFQIFPLLHSSLTPACWRVCFQSLEYISFTCPSCFQSFCTEAEAVAHGDSCKSQPHAGSGLSTLPPSWYWLTRTCAHLCVCIEDTSELACIVVDCFLLLLVCVLRCPRHAAVSTVVFKDASLEVLWICGEEDNFFLQRMCRIASWLDDAVPEHMDLALFNFFLIRTCALAMLQLTCVARIAQVFHPNPNGR